jgi:hypothetical protein
LTAVRREYLEPEAFADPPLPFRTGAVGLVGLDAEGQMELEERVRVSANTLHALEGHGVIAALNGLDLEGRLGGGLPVLCRPGLVEAARSILYAADSTTYGGQFDFVVSRTSGASPVEYRVAVVNREYQVGLVRIIDVFHRASRFGQAVWMDL